MKIHLTKEERVKLRKRKIKIADLADLSRDELLAVLETTEQRAKTITGLASFQQVPSVGLKLAEKMVYHLGLTSLDELKGADAAELFDQLEVRMGVWTDACVEDQIRCLIHHAEDPESMKVWHEFTSERKAYRKQFGYPSTRPEVPWYERAGRDDYVPDD